MLYFTIVDITVRMRWSVFSFVHERNISVAKNQVVYEFTLWRLVNIYQPIGRTCSLHFLFGFITLKNEAVSCSETSVIIYLSTRRNINERLKLSSAPLLTRLLWTLVPDLYQIHTHFCPLYKLKLFRFWGKLETWFVSFENLLVPEDCPTTFIPLKHMKPTEAYN